MVLLQFNLKLSSKQYFEGLVHPTVLCPFPPPAGGALELRKGWKLDGLLPQYETVSGWLTGGVSCSFLPTSKGYGHGISSQNHKRMIARQAHEGLTLIEFPNQYGRDWMRSLP